MIGRGVRACVVGGVGDRASLPWKGLGGLDHAVQ
jgi:hypothetical protein